MVSPKYRSRTFRRIYTKLPGNKVVIHYKRRMPKKAHCGSCGSELKAVPRALTYKMMNMPKSYKRPERPYGGNLCSRCMRNLFVEKARSK